MFTFHLQEGTKFHNGREVVAGDFKYQWERLSDPANKSNYNYLLANGQGLRRPAKPLRPRASAGWWPLDNYTLQVTLAYPYADFPYVVAFPRLCSGSQGRSR